MVVIISSACLLTFRAAMVAEWLGHSPTVFCKQVITSADSCKVAPFRRKREVHRHFLIAE